MKVLIADDDRDLMDLIAFTLSQAGYLAVKAADGTAALALFDSEAPDLLVLDINMPGASGFKVCEAIRSQSAVPIMMLTARNEEEDLVRSLELGADDYLTKPFSPRELLLRIKKILARGGVTEEKTKDQLRYGDLVIDVPRHVASWKGKAIELTATEFKLLTTLAQRTGRVQSPRHPPNRNTRSPERPARDRSKA